MFKDRLRKIYLYRNALWHMALKNLKSKYSSSVLGLYWAIINPLLIMLAVSFVFSIIFKTEINKFPFFVLSGIFPWLFFSTAISESTASILNQQGILRQFNLPKEIIPLSTVLSNFLNFLIGWIVIYPLFVFLNPGIISMFPWLIIILILNLIFICGLSLILSILNVLFRDIGQLLGFVLMLWVWVTPIFYSVDMVPQEFKWVCGINPLTPFIVYYREIIFFGKAPSLFLVFSVSILSISSLLAGLMVFSRLESNLLKRI
ncbi:MAG: ABC transporter permease [Candidatus Omnitrophica bacterium]|nr:ABC transporter permease [Candidatus Omnitrophota bacterium]MBU1870079.1 ABC transporter permease [Candidatus Omnitrophota bacterium]